jgi:hypothetical protein
MIRKIFKWWLKPGAGTQEHVMPSGAEYLTVQVQGGTPCVWSLIDPSAPFVKITFDVFATGQSVDNTNRTYLGTYQLDDGELIYHVFVRI